jgi:hypothetical protein
MEMNPDIRWKQRFQNFDRGFVLLRGALERKPETLSMLEKEGVIQRIEDTFHVPAMSKLHEFFMEKSRE